jgi:hypothetical protein
VLHWRPAAALAAGPSRADYLAFLRDHFTARQ